MVCHEMDVEQLNTTDKILLLKKVCGIVIWFNVKKGYGFISRHDTKEDVFVHRTGINSSKVAKGDRSLCSGEEVQFAIVLGNKGTEAVNVTGPEGGSVMGSLYCPRRRRYRKKPEVEINETNETRSSFIYGRQGYGSPPSEDGEGPRMPIIGPLYRSKIFRSTRHHLQDQNIPDANAKRFGPNKSLTQKKTTRTNSENTYSNISGSAKSYKTQRLQSPGGIVKEEQDEKEIREQSAKELYTSDCKLKSNGNQKRVKFSDNLPTLKQLKNEIYNNQTKSIHSSKRRGHYKQNVQDHLLQDKSCEQIKNPGPNQISTSLVNIF